MHFDKVTSELWDGHDLKYVVAFNKDLFFVW